MAQVVPNLTSLPIDSTAAPSVEDIQARLPSICVDYLSHDWAEEDVWASWRSMTRHKNEIANGVRLENASWRTWWKQRNKLKTISPETLNWLKDSDVTWLYGPLHTAVEPVPPPKVATAEERLGLSRADSSNTGSTPHHRHGDSQPTKPILKHRTLSEMLSIPNPSSPILEAVRTEEVDDHDLDESRPILLHTKSDTNIVTKGHHQRRKSPPRGPISSGSRTPITGPSSSGSRTPTTENAQGGAGGGSGGGGGGQQAQAPLLQQQPSKKHISFNTFVEQCIAVDDPDEIAGIEGLARDQAGLEGGHDDEDDEDDEDDDDDDDAMLEMKSVSSAASTSARSNSIRSNSTRSSRPSLSRQGSQASSQPDHMTIAKIAPTTLKTLGDFPSPSPQLAYAPTGEYAERRDSSEQDQADQAVVAFKNQAAGGYPIAIHQGGGGRDSSVSPHSVGSPTWDDEDDYAVGFDYFSGPDLGVGDEYDTAKRGSAAAAAAAAGAAATASGGTNSTRTVQSHVGNAGHYGKSGAPTTTTTPTVVGQVPAQPKWRSGSASSSGATTPSGSGNNSFGGAGSPASTAKPSPGSQSSTSPDFANISSPPQPGRSILKIRPPGSQQAYYEPETSPTNSHFNWKPSAATGQGGLESGVRRVIKEPVAGSLPSYDLNDSYFVQSGGGGPGNETPPLQSATSSAAPVAPTSPGVVTRDGESRGRSAVRTGANVAERSASRSATGATGSTAAATSISPSLSRTAVQVPNANAAAKSPSTKSDSNNSSSTPKSPPIANETPSAPQVQRPVGLGGAMPRDDVDMKRERQAKGQEERSDDADDRTAEYVPDRGSTPTPHSSPQVAIRPLVDTSPASLPHAQTVHVAGRKQTSGGLSAAEQSASTLKAQNNVTLGGVRRHQRGASVGSTSGGSSTLGSGFFKSSLSQQQTPPAEEDGGLISNITTTARDLFGALWTYGGQTSGSHAQGNVSREPSSKEEIPES